MPNLLFACFLVMANPVACSAESSLPTREGRIRQFAFDGDAATAFESDRPAGEHDQFSLVLDGPVPITSLSIRTGRPDGTGKLLRGTVEVSADGSAFRKVADFAEGRAGARIEAGLTKVIRIKPVAEEKEGFVLAEIDFEPASLVAKFHDPVEFVLDCKDAPELVPWLERAARACERAYPMINEELRGPGHKPATVIHMSLKSDYQGVAEASGNRIKGAVRWFKRHPDDVGALIHETAHVVQAYRGGRPPGWLVEGVADYVRFFRYEPGKVGPIDRNRAKATGGYRETAAFLDYLTRTYDKEIVLKLNRAMRERTYREDLFKEYTGKDLKQLDEEWRSKLK
jgi:hypothetical protein